MKNIGMKENMKENIQRILGESLESLKSLKSLMQIFAESANSAKQIFATFATFAMQIFSNLVNLVKLVMQIFHKGSYSEVSVSVGQHPTNIQRISNLSLTVRPTYNRFTTNSVLSRLCLVSLILMSVGVGNAWGNEAKISGSTFNNGSSTSKTWSGPHANFSISGEDIAYTSTLGGYMTAKGGKTYTISWTKDEGCNISVTNVKFHMGNPSINGYNVYVNGSKVNSVSGWNTGKDVSANVSAGNDGNITLETERNSDIYSITITYSITAKTPSVETPSTSVNVTVNPAAKQTVDIRSFFSIANAPSDFVYEYEKSGGEWNETGVFYATIAGTYTVKARIAAGTDHNASSSWSSNCTITVNHLTPTLTLSGTTGTVDKTNDVESPNTFNLRSLISAYVGDGISYSVSSANSDYAHFSGDNFYATQAGDYTIVITSNQGDQYSSISRSVTITVRDKARPSFTMNYTQETANTLLAEDGRIENAFTLTNVSGDGYFACNISQVVDDINNGDGKVIEYNAESNTIIAHNAGTATLQFVQTENDDYYGGSSAVYTFIVSKHQTSFTGSAYNLMVDGTQTANYSYTNTSAAQPTANSSDNFYYTIDDVTFTNSAKNNGTNFVTFNPSNKQIAACNAGTGKITLHQKETYKYTGATKSFDVAVYKYNSVFANVADLNVKVEENVSSAYTLTYTKPNDAYIGADNHSAGIPGLNEASGDFYYTLAQNVTTDVTAGSDQPTWAITYDATSKTATGKNAGTGTIHLYQKETYKYNAADEDLDVNVSKHTTAFTWNSASTPFYYKSDIEGIFSSNTAVDRVESSNPAVAEMEGTTLHIYNVNETTNITFTKEEDYKWTGLEQTYVVTPVNRTNQLPFSTWSQNELNKFLINSETVDDDNSAWWHDDCIDICRKTSPKITHKYLILGFDGIPDKLRFRYRLNGSNSSLWYITVGSSLSSVTDTIWKSTSNSDSWSDIVELQLAPTVRYVKFGHDGDNDAQFKDITITELNKFELDAANLNFGLQGANYGRQMMTVGFNHANAGRITRAEIIGTDAAYYSVEPEEISGTGRELYGAVALRVYFDNKETSRAENEPYSAQLRVYDNMAHSQTIDLTGYRNGKSIPVFTFNPNHAAYYVSTTINTPAVSSNKQTALTITSEQANIVEVVDGSLQMKAVGTATIVVSQEETTDYRAHSERYTITTKAMPSLALPFALTKDKCTAEAKFYGVENGSWNDGENAIRLGNGNGWPNGWGVRGFKVEFSGVPDSLTFGYKASRGTVTHDISFGAPYFYVEESPNGDDDTWTQVWFKKDNNTTTNFVKVALKPTTQFVRFVYDGNYYAYYNNISITRLDGVKYMMTDDGKYLSRGADYGTSAIVDDFGTPVRVTRYTTDNTNIYTKVQFMDSREYLLEQDGNVYTDNSGRVAINWIQISDGTGKVKVQSGNGSNKYITVDESGKLTLTSASSEATPWYPEDYAIHGTHIDAVLNTMADSAARHDFGDKITTIEKMRTSIVDEDFELEEITIDDVELAEHKSTDDNRTSSYSATKTGLPSGLYRLTVQALYRPSRSPIDWENHSKGMEGIVAFIYANDAKFPVKSVFDETGASGITYAGTDTVCGGKHYPTDLTAAADAFKDRHTYLHDLYVYIGEEGTLNYGIENASYVPGTWLVYNDFKLERIARKEYIFDGNDGTSMVWGEKENWEYMGGEAYYTPNEHNIVTIRSNVEIISPVAVHTLAIENNAIVTIRPNGGLTVGKGGVSGGSVTQLKLKADSNGKTGYVRISPEYEGEMPEAEIEMFTKAYYNRATASAEWQCVGIPISETNVMAKNVFTDSYLYNWDESTTGWYNRKSKTRLAPFTGYETTQAQEPEGLTVTYQGHLVSGHESYKVALQCSDAERGYNALANSFAAPIAIANFDVTDFERTEATIYILNSGTKAQSDAPANGADAPGKFLAIPVTNAKTMAEEYDYPLYIPSMQGFWVRALSVANPTSITFDYNRLVWGAEYDADTNKPLRAPKRQTEGKIGTLKITLYANEEVDHLYFLKSEDYDVTFENGYDARKMMSAGLNIFSIEEDDYMAIDATNSIIGTRVGVRTGSEEAYTLTFSHVDSGDELVLWDKEAEEQVAISEGQTYTFFAEPNSEITGRFVIIEADEADAPSVTTGMEETTSKNAKVHKFIKDDKLFVLKNGVLYDATGMRVR